MKVMNGLANKLHGAYFKAAPIQKYIYVNTKEIIVFYNPVDKYIMYNYFFTFDFCL